MQAIHYSTPPPIAPTNHFNIYAAIDIGSNTIMMTLASHKASSLAFSQKSNSNHNSNPAHAIKTDDLSHVAWGQGDWQYQDFIRFVSLGENMETTGEISAPAITRAKKALQEYSQILDAWEKNIIKKTNGKGKLHLRVSATSAMREAKNGKLIQNQLAKILNNKIEIINGEEEGRLTFLGACSPIKLPAKKKNIALIDIGGGSSEINLAIAGEYKKTISLPIGAVRWLNRYPQIKLAKAKIAKSARKEVMSIFLAAWEKEVSPEIIATLQPCTYYAVAGVPTTLAAVYHNVKMDQFYKLEKKKMNFKDIEEISSQLLHTDVNLIAQDNKRWSAINKNRAKVMPISCIIFSTLLHALQQRLGGEKKVQVSVKGLRYGLLQEIITKN